MEEPEGVRINLLEDLDEAERATLVEATTQRALAVGEAVFSEGEEGDRLYVVLEGGVRIEKSISTSVTRTLAELETGEVFGEMALIGEGLRSASAVATTEAQVLVIDRESFLRLLDREAALGLKLLTKLTSMLAERLRVTTDLLRETAQWSLEVSGAARLDLGGVIQAGSGVVVELMGGRRIEGRLLKAEPNEGGLALTLADDQGGVVLVPYHAVVSLEVPRDLLAVPGEE